MQKQIDLIKVPEIEWGAKLGRDPSLNSLRRFALIRTRAFGSRTSRTSFFLMSASRRKGLF
jgi:hypothetical protein